MALLVVEICTLNLLEYINIKTKDKTRGLGLTKFDMQKKSSINRTVSVLAKNKLSIPICLLKCFELTIKIKI